MVAAPQYRAAANTAMGWKNSNLRTEITRLLRRAGVSGSPRLFHSMRASRQTELQREFPMHVVCSWLGNSQLTELAKRQKLLNQITEDARIFIQNWAEVEELLDAANEEERTQIIRHYIEVIELHASDTKGETGTYAMRLFPEVRPDWFVGWSEQYLDELIYHEMRSPETTNGDAAPEGGTAAVLTDSRLVCTSDGKAPRTGLESATGWLTAL